MIIKAITLENFKGIREPVRIELKPITLLFGPNSAGKSTILQAMVYAREVLERHNLDPDRTVLGGEWMDLGGFHSLVNNHHLDRPIIMGFELDLSEVGVSDYLSATEEFMLESWEHQRAPDEWLDNVQQAVVMFSIIWSELLNRPVIESLKVEINYQEFAEITSSRDSKNIYIETINAEHPILEAISVDAENMDNWFVDELLQSSLKIRLPDNSLYEPSINFDDLLSENQLLGDSVSYRKSYKGISDKSNGININELKERVENSKVEDVLTFQHIGLLDQKDALPVREQRLQLASDTWVSTGYDYSPFADHPLAAELLITSVFSGLIVGPLDVLASELDKLLYIGPLRDVPKRGHNVLRSPELSRWARGLAAWDTLLSKPEPLVDKVNDWLESDYKFNSKYRIENSIYKLLDVNGPLYKTMTGNLNVDEEVFSELIKQYLVDVPERRELKILSTDTSTRLEPADLGVGISQVIPVIVAALNSRSDLIAIEQPELHIHPAWQTVLGDLFITSSKENDALFLIETHSEHLMLRLLRRIRETTDNELPPGAPSITPDQIAVYFIENTEDGVSMTPIRIDEDGEFKDRWPKGFFGERREELM